MSESTTPTAPALTLRNLIILAIPAIAIGVGSALMLWLLDVLSEQLSHLLWTTLPGLVGASASTGWWIVVVLTAAGAAVGAIVWLVPGHGGYDSAVTELNGPFPKMRALPSVAAVVVIGLAAGVSLGPENPIIAINAALAIGIIGRAAKAIPEQLIAMLTVAGTIGALFGTPVAAALIFTGVIASVNLPGSLWDKLFLPVTAAGAGSLTMLLLHEPTIAFTLPPMGPAQPMYLVYGLVIAAVSALVAIVAAWLLPLLHRAFHALRNPLVFTTLGGLILGLLGALGGPITMFKGLDQTAQLLMHPQDYTAGQLAAFAGIKLVALLVAAAAGFRGGRIFPIVFVGAALGLLGHALIPDVPLGLAVACAGLGVVLVATRDGWLAMFLGVALTGDITILPLLCLIILPVWLLVSKAPELVVHPPAPHADASAPPATAPPAG